MRTFVLFVILAALLSAAFADGDCTVADDKWQVSTRRSEFTWSIDHYARGWIGAADFNSSVQNLLDDDFTTAVVQTPFGTTTYTGKQATVNWLLSLPTAVYAGFADHRLVNFRFYPVDDFCNPNEIVQYNYSPNRLLIHFGPGAPIEIEEISNEKMAWVKRDNGHKRDGDHGEHGEHGEHGAPYVWNMKSYYVNSTKAMQATEIDFYAAALGVPQPSGKKK